mgnify:CR=1 FL=1
MSITGPVTAAVLSIRNFTIVKGSNQREEVITNSMPAGSETRPPAALIPGGTTGTTPADYLCCKEVKDFMIYGEKISTGPGCLAAGK